MKPTYSSEFDGRGVMPNTVYPKGSDALTPADKLRLQSITGQELDSRAPVDPHFWQGGVGPDEAAEEAAIQARRQEAQAREQIERERYRESTR